MIEQGSKEEASQHGLEEANNAVCENDKEIQIEGDIISLGSLKKENTELTTTPYGM